ncbi:MAG: GHMP kinase [Bryobacteraceae bacterium]|jgi:D-glycero-alpha-D-manno-heptose-7-phosphate kinase
MKITAKAPCRVDMAGGTLDIWPLYLFHAAPVTVNFAVDRYASCAIETRADARITLRSRDLHGQEEFESLAALRAARRYKLPLAAHVVRYFAPATGLDLATDSEAPAGAGISGSSTLIIALAAAFNRLTNAGHKLEKLREIAQNIEARIIRVPTGCQDYYPAMYGGVSAIELTEAGVVRKAVAVEANDLNERVVLAYTGVPRNSGINNWEVMKAHIGGDRAVHRNFDRIAQIACAMRQALEKPDWNEVARLLRQEWTHRKKNAPGISTPLIDRLVEVTRRHGAVGAKVCGAGGGGCVLFLVDRGAKLRVSEAIQGEGATVLPVRVAPRGVRVSGA